MKRVIFSYVLLVSGLGTAENPSISYSEELWNQYTDSETVLVKKMDDTDKKISKLKSVNRNPKPGSGVVANWARQRTGKSTAELKKERTHLKELGKLVLESRNEVQAQQERMRTIQFVQSQTNELSPPLLEEALSRLTNQIGQLVKMEKTLMTKMGMPVQKIKKKKKPDTILWQCFPAALCANWQAPLTGFRDIPMRKTLSYSRIRMYSIAA